MEKKKKKTLYMVYVIIMVILTVVYSLIMVCLAGAGLIYNGESYGRELVNVGIWLIVSGVLLTSGAAVSFLGKRVFSVISAVITIAGLGICLVMVYILCTHADSAGWADNYTMEPVSRMYRERLLPVIAPAVMTLGVDFFKSR